MLIRRVSVALLLLGILSGVRVLAQETKQAFDVETPKMISGVEFILEPENLFEKYGEDRVRTDHPLQLGDANDRVRELQASLNRALSGAQIQVRDVYVGDAQGKLSDPNSTTPEAERDPSQMVRYVWSDRRKRGYVVRGNWNPIARRADTGEIEQVSFTEGETENMMAKTDWVELPPDPIKVDGVYGQHTEAAVALFQWQQRLPVTGVVDVVTLDKLEPMVPTNPVLARIMSWVGSKVDGMYLKKPDDLPWWIKTITSLLTCILIVLASFIAYNFALSAAKSTRFLSRWLFTPESSPWFNALRESRVFTLAAQFAPALFIYFAALLIFPRADETHDNLPYLNVFQSWRDYVSNLGLAYLSLVLMLVLFAIANAADAIYNPNHETENPIGSMVRAAKRLIAVIGTLMICASLAGRHPFYIIGGLGAFTAIFLLVFRDHLLGLVASIQIIANKVVSVGDWIAMPKFNADGDVLEISLGLIKVQNFDKTISTIPTSAVLTESFRNWTGMQVSGGRRIKRAILIDMNTIQVCTPAMIDRFESIELIHHYIREKRDELSEYNRTHDIDASTVNSRRLTNIGTFRAYLEAYLGTHPGLSKEMTFLVRHLQPTSNGLPIEIYAFCGETDWSAYEAVQADIFDHVLAILPEFGLQTFQELTDTRDDLKLERLSAEIEKSIDEIEQSIGAENASLIDNPRRRVETSLRRLRRDIKAAGVEEYIDAEADGRIIKLRMLQAI